MQCIQPLSASFDEAGNITFSSKKRSKELVPFAFECRKCLPCRLNNAREKAIRAVHEAKTHKNNIFLTLTYDDEHLSSSRLVYKDFQDFMKKLRHTQDEKITYIVTGEYGEKNKRPHWHALIFNFRPKDELHLRSTERGDRVYTSKLISDVWSSGRHEYGDLTLDSASYTCRYAAKKLVHGSDQDHDYHPIHKTSSRRAIGRSWIEKYAEQTFKLGYIIHQGNKFKIPRYYVDWARKHRSDLWFHYVTEVRPKIHETVIQQSKKEFDEWLESYEKYGEVPKWDHTRPKIKETILKAKFKRLQEKLKL